MPTFVATINAENFPGTPGGTDVVDYRPSTGGVTVDVLGGGTGNFAEGDSYTSIERYFLTDISTEVDTFIGSDADERVQAFSGPNVLMGMGGDDILRGGDDRNVLNGGTGLDRMFGGTGDDRFDVAAGDAVAGEAYRGFAGTDTIRLIAGGTGSEVDLSEAVLNSIDVFEFTTDVTLMLASVQLMGADVLGTLAGTGEVVEVVDWDAQAENVDLDKAFELIDNGVDAVRWAFGGDTGDVTLTEEVRDEDTGDTAYVETFVNDGPVDLDLASNITFYDIFYNIFRTIRTKDDGEQTITEFDPVSGDVLEKQIWDLSAGGTGFNFQYRFLAYDSEGQLEYRLSLFDTEEEKEDIFTDGVLSAIFYTDTSDDGSAFSYDTIEEVFEDDGNGGVQLSYRKTVNDASETFAVIEQYFENGTIERTVRETQNGVGSTVGTNVDQTFVATENNEVIAGRGGTDTFVFSGDVGNTRLNAFGNGDQDLLDLTAYGIDSRDELEDAGALSYDAVNLAFTIDVSQIGGSGSIILRNVVDGDFGNDDFILI